MLLRFLRPGILALSSICAFLVPADASRIKDLASIGGGRDNQLTGYGIVVGLAGDGDSNSQKSTLSSIANVLQRHGITVDPTQIKARNTAAVMITADIAAFLKPGSRIDVTIASLGDAKSLQGGVLLQTPLIGADGRVYAVGQGPISVGGFLGGASGPGGATVQKNHPTVGMITNGAIVEREIPTSFVNEGILTLQLHNPDFTSATRMANAINTRYPAAAALPLDAATINVQVPELYAGREVAYLAELGAIEITPDTLARVVINERTGTIVATSSVRLSQVAISHGSLTITVSSTLGVSQPMPYSGGQTAVVPSTQTDVSEARGGFQVIPETPSIERLAAALNALGVSTREMMAIFQTLKRSGALQAELVIN